MKAHIWKNLTLSLLALLIGACVTSLFHNGRLASIEESVQDIRERVVRIETKLEARAGAYYELDPDGRVGYFLTGE